MSNKEQWVTEIISILESVGGKASLNDIYIEFEERKKVAIKDYVDWRAQVRKYIYLNSSDTDIFKGSINSENDIFYSVKGKGKGLWGLRTSRKK